MPDYFELNYSMMLYDFFPHGSSRNPGFIKKLTTSLPKTMSSIVNCGKLFRVALTGGPCAGKSTVIGAAQELFSKQGVQVLTVPEAPTLLMSNGCKFPGYGSLTELLGYEKALIKLQIALENSFNDIAFNSGKDSIVIYDRAIFDIQAYLPNKAIFGDIVQDIHETEEQLLKRYDCVIHLNSCAKGAESFYTTANNGARTETIEEAAALDDKILDAWRMHPKVFVVENTSHKDSFQRKVDDAKRIILREYEAKFKL